MTSVTFHTEAGRITGFEAKGHSGWAEAGEDLLCASITAAVTLVEATVNDVLGLAAAVRIDGDKALISLRLPGALGPTAESTCQTLLPFPTILPQFFLKYIQYSCEKLCLSGEKIPHHCAHFHFSNGA